MTNRTLFITLGVLLALCLLCACCAAASATAYFLLRSDSSTQPEVLAPSLTPEPVLTPIPPDASPSSTPVAACPSAMQAVIDAAEGQAYGNGEPGLGDTNSEPTHPDSVTLAEYPVRGDSLGEPHLRTVRQDLQDLQQNRAAQTEAWNYFTAMIPSDQRGMITEYVVFTDGPGNILASVQQSFEGPDRWVVEIDAADLANRQSLMFTLVHEFAHLLTLNASQVPPDLQIYNEPDNPSLYDYKLESCPTYFPGEGCSRSDSYINLFYDRFWTPIAEEWRQVDALSEGDDIERYYEELYAFYEAHEDQFVNDYAATNPSEDMAESFSYFIFGSRPQGDRISDQKILFYYEFPELVQLRDRILQGFCETHP